MSRAHVAIGLVWRIERAQGYEETSLKPERRIA
jgi:hypothetical protein